ncbi:MAG: DUF2784 domain-containing protein [Deltaproteobacteria bacterium]|nr:DUF2784 domain-containing protein [Deltaproteobacteria bacterium]
MLYKLLADAVVLVHFLWIVFLFLGALWGRRSRTIKIFHLSGLAFALIIQIFGWFCPLTHLEAWLRAKHNPNLTYAGSFIIYYVERIVYIEISHYIVLIVTLLLGGLNVWIYLRK